MVKIFLKIYTVPKVVFGLGCVWFEPKVVFGLRFERMNERKKKRKRDEKHT